MNAPAPAPIGSVILDPASLPTHESDEAARAAAVAEPLSSLLRRAADRLVDVEGRAYDGADAIAALEDIDVPLATMVTTLRPVAAPLAEWLRAIADHYDHHGVGNFLSDVGRAAAERLIPGFPQAVAVARAVLGETDKSGIVCDRCGSVTDDPGRVTWGTIADTRRGWWCPGCRASENLIAPCASAVLGETSEQDRECCPSCIVIDGDPPAVQPHDGHTCWRCGCEDRQPAPARAVLGETEG